MSTRSRWRGLKDLVQEAVEQGSRAVERVQTETARRPFELLERIPPLTTTVRGIHAIYDAAVATSHLGIRTVTKVVGTTLDLALDAVQSPPPAGLPPGEPAKEGGGPSEGLPAPRPPLYR